LGVASGCSESRGARVCAVQTSSYTSGRNLTRTATDTTNRWISHSTTFGAQARYVQLGIQKSLCVGVAFLTCPPLPSPPPPLLPPLHHTPTSTSHSHSRMHTHTYRRDRRHAPVCAPPPLHTWRDWDACLLMASSAACLVPVGWRLSCAPAPVVCLILICASSLLRGLWLCEFEVFVEVRQRGWRCQREAQAHPCACLVAHSPPLLFSRSLHSCAWLRKCPCPFAVCSRAVLQWVRVLGLSPGGLLPG
jgi:hypothetical protein